MGASIPAAGHIFFILSQNEILRMKNIRYSSWNLNCTNTIGFPCKSLNFGPYLQRVFKERACQLAKITQRRW